MSHFAVYALTRNVGIDIVPPAAASHYPDLQSSVLAHSPTRDIPLYPALSPSEFLISPNSYRRIIALSSSRRVEIPRAVLFWRRYNLSVLLGQRAR